MIATEELTRDKDDANVACCDDTCCDSSESSSEADEEIKLVVKTNYGEIAENAQLQGGCGCGCGTAKNIAPDSYSTEDGYNPDADLGLGCGLPNQFAELQTGEHVLDLGSGAGLDAFIARKAVGDSGRVVGVDMTEQMLKLARKNTQKLGYSNVDFVQGELEDLPLERESIDVAVSNCVFNLVPNKKTAFSEVHRVLRPGGRFSISDIVYSGELPEAVQNSVAMYVGCVAGAVSLETYLNIILETGFRDVAVRSISTVDVDGFTGKQNDDDALRDFVENGGRVLSITVTGLK